MNAADQIMNLADSLADAKVAHAEVVGRYARNEENVEWADVVTAANVWIAAMHVLRTAVKDLADAATVAPAPTYYVENAAEEILLAGVTYEEARKFAVASVAQGEPVRIAEEG